MTYLSRRLPPLALALALSAPAAPCYAYSVAQLYEGEVEVRSQAVEERNKAFAAALWDVLVKVTGDRTVPSRPELQPLFQRAERLVQQYRYREIEQPPRPAAAADAVDYADASARDERPSHSLWVQFAAEAIERQLGQLGIRLWGKERPQTLVWLAVQDGPQRYLLSANARDEVSEQLWRAAKLRGVPLLLPVLDMADRAAVDFADIRGNFARPLLDASKRYGVSSILAGNLTRVGAERWSAQWTLYRYANTSSWREQDHSLPESVLSGIEGLAGVLSAELAVGRYGSALEQVRLTVNDVAAMRDYAQVMAYLQGLSLVEEAMVERVSVDTLTVALRVRGDSDDLRRAIALGNTLVAVGGDAQAPAPSRELHYVYLP